MARTLRAASTSAGRSACHQVSPPKLTARRSRKRNRPWKLRVVSRNRFVQRVPSAPFCFGGLRIAQALKQVGSRKPETGGDGGHPSDRRQGEREEIAPTGIHPRNCLRNCLRNFVAEHSGDHGNHQGFRKFSPRQASTAPSRASAAAKRVREYCQMPISEARPSRRTRSCETESIHGQRRPVMMVHAIIGVSGVPAA